MCLIITLILIILSDNNYEMKNIISHLRNDESQIGGIGKFTILVANERINVSWYKSTYSNIYITQGFTGSNLELDDIRINDDDNSILKIEKYKNGIERTLLIKNCTQQDFGVYSVRFDDGKIVEESKAKLSILRNYFKRTENLFFLTKPDDDTVRPGIRHHQTPKL